MKNNFKKIINATSHFTNYNNTVWCQVFGVFVRRATQRGRLFSSHLHSASVPPEGNFPPVSAAQVMKEAFVSLVFADSLSPPVNVTIKAVKANSAVVTWDIPEGDPVIGFAITQQVGNVPHL